MFLRLADGVDDDTWLFHLGKRDYSKWFRDDVKDKDLAAEVAAVEADRALDANESRAAIQTLVEARYSISDS